MIQIQLLKKKERKNPHKLRENGHEFLLSLDYSTFLMREGSCIGVFIGAHDLKKNKGFLSLFFF